MRDVLLGFLMWVLMIGALVGVCVLCQYLFGPPMADRARSMAFIGGGGALFIATLILAICGGIVYSSVTGGLVR